MRKAVRSFTALVFLSAVFLFGMILYYQRTMPEQFSVTVGKQLELNGIIKATDEKNTDVVQLTAHNVSGSTYRSQLSLFGLIPIKTVSVKVVDEPVVVVAGIPFGIKMYTDGVLIVGFSDVDTAAGPCNPARIAGLKLGDVVLSVNSMPVSTNGELRTFIEESAGSPLTFVIRRDNLRFTVQFKPVKSVNENRYKSGFWVRDSSAGIGTLTFFDPVNKVFGGLGHAVCDVDTDETLPISSGEIVSARILDVQKGAAGDAGSLEGTVSNDTIGILSINAETGVYGTLTHLPRTNFQTVPVAMKQHVQTGKAEVLTTVSGTTPAAYEIEIVQIKYNDSSPTKNMTIRITDPRLLEKTGGIVQGMSGSPILQNGKLVGAVTHVLINDPTKGYAIFAENMLTTAAGVDTNAFQTAA